MPKFRLPKYVTAAALRASIAAAPVPKAFYRPGDWDDQNGQATADHVIDDPRQPRIQATGVLNEQGEMIFRVAVPIKLARIGFGPHPDAPALDEEDEVHFIVTENQLHVIEDAVSPESIGYLTLEDVGDGGEEEDDEEIDIEEAAARIQERLKEIL